MIRIKKIKIFCFLLCFSLGELSAQTIALQPEIQVQKVSQVKTETQEASHPQTETTMPAESIAYDNPETLLLDFWNKMKELGNQEIETAEKTEAFRSLFVTYFNQKHINRLVLGRYWKTINDQEKEKFSSVFLDHLLLTFAHQINHYFVKGIFQILHNRERRPGYHIITSQLLEPNKMPKRISWIIIKSKETKSYKISDVQIEGISLCGSWRADFSSILRQQGINGLIDRIAKLVNRNKENDY